MNVRERLFVIALSALSTLGSSLLLPGSVLAQGQQTCNGFLDIAYVGLPTSAPCTSPPGFMCTTSPQGCACCVVGADQPTVQMEITLGAGSIDGGTNLQVFNFLAGLDCRRFLPIIGVDTTCAPNPDSPRVTFADDITTTCPATPGPGDVTWTATQLPHPPNADQLFTFMDPIATPGPPPVPSLLIPANNPTFCTVDFKFKVNTPPSDASCTTGAAPLNCCTGAGTGFCEKTDNAACTDVSNPFPCCTGAGTGFCGFTNADCTGFQTPVACCVAANTGLCNVIQSGMDSACTTGPAPFSCCTGAGTGFCEANDNAACTGFLAPFPCCRGAGTGNCGDIFQLARYVVADCDNHVLVSSQTQTAELPMCVVVTPTDFDCYQADSAFSSSGHTLTDVFGTFTNVQVGSAQRLCAPAVKVTDSSQPSGTLPTEHLVAYMISSNLKRKVAGVTVNSPQFGSFTVDVTKVSGKASLLVPSNKTVGKGTPPPPQDTNPTNHFLCYSFDTVSGGIPGPVMVRDQFNPNPPGTKPPQTVSFTKQKSWRLCVPVNKDGLDPSAPTNPNGLLCLVTGTDMNSPLNNTFVNWANQFQNPATNVHVDKLDDFCVPVTVTP